MARGKARHNLAQTEIGTYIEASTYSRGAHRRGTVCTGMRQRDVMSLIKQSAPLLSMEAYEEDDRPLAAAIEAAGREESCVWHRVRCCPSPTRHSRY